MVLIVVLLLTSQHHLSDQWRVSGLDPEWCQPASQQGRLYGSYLEPLNIGYQQMGRKSQLSVLQERKCYTVAFLLQVLSPISQWLRKTLNYLHSLQIFGQTVSTAIAINHQCYLPNFLLSLVPQLSRPGFCSYFSYFCLSYWSHFYLSYCSTTTSPTSTYHTGHTTTYPTAYISSTSTTLTPRSPTFTFYTDLTSTVPLSTSNTVPVPPSSPTF